MLNRLRVKPALCGSAFFFTFWLMIAPVRALQPPAAAAPGPAAPGMARVWFYQDSSPYISMNYATIVMNGAAIGAVPPYGVPIYRDVAPGHYQLAAPSEGADVNQGTEIDLAPGQVIYVKVENLPDWATPNLGSMRRDTYYLRIMPPATAQAELAQRPF